MKVEKESESRKGGGGAEYLPFPFNQWIDWTNFGDQKIYFGERNKIEIFVIWLLEHELFVFKCNGQL